MAEQGNEKSSADSGLAGKIRWIAGIFVALTALLTAVLEFRDAIPWLTPVSTIEVSPNPVNLEVGDKFQIVATVKDSKGNRLEKNVSWSTADPSLLGIENDGVVTGKSVGQTTVTASIRFMKGVAPVHVRRMNVASLDVFPPATTLQVDDHLKLDATPYDSEGNSLLGRPVRWSSEDSLVASVHETSGEAIGKSEGSVRVTAESEGKLGAAMLTVRPKVLRDAESKSAISGISGKADSNVGPPPSTGVGLPSPPMVAKPVVKMTITGGLKTGDCPADLRILIGDTLVDIKADPQEIPWVLAGELIYNLHGTVVCPRESIAVVNGHGTLSVGNQQKYRCHWRRTGPKDYVISLEPE